jgi:methylmalonyl-CoA mutase cobalamin-binding subunit
MILVPRAEQHTLGAFIAADQFRRLGFEVDVLVDLHPRQVAFALRKRRYAMIGITVSGRRTLASARELVDIIRTTVRRATPIVVGGSLIGTDQDLKTATGADHMATDVKQAIELSGLSIVELDPPQQPVDSLKK